MYGVSSSTNFCVLSGSLLLGELKLSLEGSISGENTSCSSNTTSAILALIFWNELREKEMFYHHVMYIVFHTCYMTKAVFNVILMYSHNESLYSKRI